jgi:ACT domain-containing protein
VQSCCTGLPARMPLKENPGQLVLSLQPVIDTVGKGVVKVKKAGWRPSKKGVEEMLQKMSRKELDGCVVILYGMDNG